MSVVKPETAPIKSNPIPLSPGYNTFNKRIGEADAEVVGLGGRPRSLEFDEGEEVAKAQPLVQPKEQTEVKSDVSENKVEETKEESRRRRSVTDANGNKILNVRRVRREATEEEDEEADIQTERIIQVCIVQVI